MSDTQSFKNHTRVDPLFHFFVGPIFLLNVVVAIWWHFRHHDHPTIGLWIIVLSCGLLAAVTKIRNYALKNQDRIIRLEERMRLELYATEPELAELESLTTKQYIALRFASNPELVELARRAVRENLDAKQIKQAIQIWRPDHDRV